MIQRNDWNGFVIYIIQDFDRIVMNMYRFNILVILSLTMIRKIKRPIFENPVQAIKQSYKTYGYNITLKES